MTAHHINSACSVVYPITLFVVHLSAAVASARPSSPTMHRRNLTCLFNTVIGSKERAPASYVDNQKERTNPPHPLPIRTSSRTNDAHAQTNRAKAPTHASTRRSCIKETSKTRGGFVDRVVCPSAVYNSPVRMTPSALLPFPSRRAFSANPCTNTCILHHFARRCKARGDHCQIERILLTNTLHTPE